MTELKEVIEFLDIAANQGFLNDNTAFARKTACNKFFDILDENQKSVEYIQENLNVVKTRFANLNKEVRGNTVAEYARRVQVVLSDFMAWKNDRAGWERRVSTKQSSQSNGSEEKKTRPQRTAKAKQISQENNEESSSSSNSDTRVVTFPIRQNFDISITLPREGLNISELRKLAYFLLPYTKDWEPTSDTQRNVFPMLEEVA